MRPPRGALWCLGFVLLAEVGLRLLPGSWLRTFEQGEYNEDETLDYQAVDLAIELLPPPDVLVIGTSRAREGVDARELGDRLAAGRAARPSVRNYGVAGGRIDVSLALLERLLAEGHVPRVLIVALDGSDFRDLGPNPDRARLMDLGTLPADLARNGRASEAEMTHVLGNSLDLRLVLARATLRYRLVRRGDASAAQARLGNPAFGGASAWRRQFADQLAATGQPIPMKRALVRVETAARGYVIHARALERLGGLVALATARGITVVLAEVPTSPQVRDYPGVAAVQARFRAELARLARPGCVLVWTAEAASPRFRRAHFRDPSHLNALGATLLVDLLAAPVREALATADAGGGCGS